MRRLCAALGLTSAEADEFRRAAVRPAAAVATVDDTADRTIRILILGPLVVRHGDADAQFGAHRQRAVLGRLALTPNEAVARRELIDLLWPGSPPKSAVHLVQTYVTRLRRLLTPRRTEPSRARILRSGTAGYLLRASPEELDLLRFRELLEQARAARPPTALDLLDDALSVWRAAPVDDVTALAGHPRSLALTNERIQAALQHADLADQLGCHDRSLTVLRTLSEEHPLHEPIWGRLILALAAGGLQATALRAYGQISGRLADELGIAPGPELAHFHRRVLRQHWSRTDNPVTATTANATLMTAAPSPPPLQPAPPPPANLEAVPVDEAVDLLTKIAGPARVLDDPEATATVPSGPRAVPAQLPADVQGFTGRSNALAALDGTATRVVAITGIPGVGKTVLAVHWAHRVRDRFPDGQLHLNLRGFGGSGHPTESAAAVRVFLGALGVPPEGVPAEPEAAVALYRTLLADRRVLILLDNARDAAQVRPLLPGAAGCLVLVTSRDELAGLVAAEGARPVHVGLFGPDEARQLLARRLDAQRVGAEPDAVEEIIALCAGLPLALAVVAARAATKPAFPLVRFAAQLRAGRLDALAAGDPITDVRNVFSWSYRWLSPGAARLFRLLSLCPGPDIGVAAAISLAGLPTGAAQGLLAELTQAHLVTEHSPGRFLLHDLLRTYAAELTARHDPDTDRAAAVGRILDHHLHTSDVAAVLVEPHRDRVVRAPAPPGVLPEPFADERQAQDWFTAEHQVLLAAVRLAVDAGSDRHAWQLARVLASLLDNQGRWPDLVAVSQLAIEATRRLGERTEQARAQRFLGRAYASLRRHTEAQAAYRSALDLYARLDDPVGRAAVHFALACLAESRQHWTAMHEHATQTLRLYTDAGYEPGIGRALNLLGWVHALAWNFDESLSYCHRALALQEKLSDRAGQAATWDSIGYVHHHRGEYEDAVVCYERALTLYRRCGDRYNEADVLAHLGDTHQVADRDEAARAAWRLAEQIFDDLGNAPSESIRVRLADLGPVEVAPPS